MYQISISNHKGLDVWNGAMDLAELLYRITERFPVEERFGLISQIRRAAVSVPSNIAEGAGRGSSGDFIRFLAISLGSLAELETQLILAERLGMLGPKDMPNSLIVSVRKMLVRLSKALQRKRTI